jgi:hypothetical protein
VSHIYFSSYEPGKLIPKDASKKKYFFTWDKKYNGGSLYKEKPKKESDKRTKEQIDLENAVRENESRLKELTSLCYQLRLDFIKNVSIKKSQIEDVMEMMFKAEMYATSSYCSFNRSIFDEVFETEKHSHIPAIQKECLRVYQNNPLKVAAFSAWARLNDDSKNGYWYKHYGPSSMPVHFENPKLDLIYEILERFGYKMCGEEKQLQDGTHVLYAQKTVEEVKDAKEEIIKNCTNCRYQFDSEDKCGEKCGTDFKNWEQSEDE